MIHPTATILQVIEDGIEVFQLILNTRAAPNIHGVIFFLPIYFDHKTPSTSSPPNLAPLSERPFSSSLEASVHDIILSLVMPLTDSQARLLFKSFT